MQAKTAERDESCKVLFTTSSVQQGRSAYVAGFGIEAWMWIKFNTNANGLRLPQRASLVYANLDQTRYGDESDDCFVLNSLLDIVHDLVLAGDDRHLNLAVKILQDVSSDAVLAYVVGFSRTSWMQLKGHLKGRPGQVAGTLPCLLTSIVKTDNADDAEAGIGATDDCFVMGLDPIPAAISTRRVPSALLYR
eukprot:TRINITY_DN32780_c1_g1_i2.p1 TRINITY_DN32780_c1_g1~~TRINITY_DN32780_c1_g1_i2.p1  ORF type:complete len:192 (-),score=30.29 TRINITY_DN32780_c1_g1_i2:348-923(-)